MGINVPYLNFADYIGDEGNGIYWWEYAITKADKHKYYISKNNMTSEEAQQWSDKIKKKNYSLMTIEKIRSLIS